MDIRGFLSSAQGQWKGDYKLWLDPNKDPAESQSTLALKPTANGSFFLIHYDWLFQDKKRAGVFLIGGKDTMAQATWGDSFHMQPLPMVCDGELRQGLFILNGTYLAGEETWGWRTEFSNPDKQLIMRAYNIEPSGQEDIALEAIYQPHA